MELLALLLSLILSILKVSLSAPPPPLLSSQFRTELLILLLGDAQSFAGLGVKIFREPGLVSSIFHLFLSHKDLLDGLHKNNKGMLYQIRKR